MKTFITGLSLCCSTILFAQTPPLFLPDSNTVGLWHLDETTGSLLQDASFFHNNAQAVGTTVVPGVFGRARYFNGRSDYAYVPDPLNGSLDFGVNQSFTVEAWFRTTSLTEQRIVRKGLAPVPGYELGVSQGKVFGIIGNREDGIPPDTLLRVISSANYNDNVWHHAVLIRDRVARKLYLYVDEVQAAAPVNDNFPYSLANDLPLGIGRWYGSSMPLYFQGTIDEVRISNRTRFPSSVTSDTVALYHYDEQSGSTVVDSSPYHNNGLAIGTTIVQGQSGLARTFNGISEYISVPNPTNSAFNFGTNESFTVEARFKTTVSHSGWLIRRGLVPYAGFGIAISNDRVYAVIGNVDDHRPPDTLLIIISDRPYIDGQWHTASLVRDRSRGRLFLYVDGVQAAAPLVDNFPLPLYSSERLLMGRSPLDALPQYFSGSIDEIRVFRGARHPASANFPNIVVSPTQLNFGNVLVGTNSLQQITVSNVWLRDWLQIGVETNNPVFNATIPITYPIPPGTSRNVPVIYPPTAARTDTGSLLISSNDPNRPIVRVPLSGQGFTATAAPFITSIRDIPEDQGKQVRVVWYKSVHDSSGDPLRIVEYNLWRRVGSNDALWDFIASVPAVQFTQYAYVAPTLFDSTRSAGIRWSVFKVSAHTVNGAQVFFSQIDSGYSVDNLPPYAPTSFAASFGGGRVNLTWVPPPDPDIVMFAVYRSTTANFIPSSENQVGTTHTSGFVDQNISGNSAYYYCVAAFDTAGNQGAFSNQLRVSLTDVPGGGTMPADFALYQNYPNPFNPSSVIRYDVPANSYVSIKVFDMLGREIATLVDGQKTAGHHSVSWSAQNLSSGIYFYTMKAGSFTSIKKMLLLR